MTNKRKYILSLIILSLFLFFSFSLYFAVIWIDDFFGELNMEQILFHIKAPLEGTDINSFYSGFSRIPLPALLITVSLVVIVILIRKSGLAIKLPALRRSRRKPRKRLPIAAAAYVVAVLTGLSSIINAISFADEKFDLFQYISDQRTASEFIENNYISPVNQLVFPEQKRNLVYIYLESIENTFASESAGGAFPDNYIPELTTLASEYISFSNTENMGGSNPVGGTTWTIASMFAHSTGLPLKIPISGNSMSKHEEFLPGVISIGEILRTNGYDNYLMIGSDATFGGRRTFFEQHGQYEIYDYVWARREGKIPPGYHVWWGFEDTRLFDLAKEQLTEISSRDKPFNFTMLTVDTHHENGYVCDLCDDEYIVQYANVLACSSRQVYQFVRWLQEQDFYENTTVVIVGDHLTMDSDFALNVDPDYVRTTYNVFINPAPGVAAGKTKNRTFTPFDYFPTTLAGLGITVHGDRIGLGTNLFSGKRTLYEEFGHDFLVEINRKSKFYDREFIYRDANDLNSDT